MPPQPVGGYPEPEIGLMTRFQKLALAALVMGYLLVVLGGVVRVGGHSACNADWPLCRGALLPLPSGGLWTAITLAHRLLAALVTLLTLGLTVAAWRARQRGALILSGLAVLVVLVQVALGGAVATRSASAAELAAHLGLAQLYLGVLIMLALLVFAPAIAAMIGRPSGRSWSALGPVATVAAAAVLLLIVTGAYTAVRPATGCGWPLCGGRVVPTGLGSLDVQLIHRWVALVASLAVLAAAVLARRARSDAPALVALLTAAGVLMVAQIFVGAASVWMQLNGALAVAHLAVATLVFGLLVSGAVLDYLLPVVEVEPRPARGWQPVGADYLTLTKPNVMVLLLITTLGAMLIAQGGLPPLRILFWTLVGGALSSGGAAALNHYMDRDIDALMKRTSKRPLPGKRIPAVHVPIFGVTLTVLAVYLLTVFVNPLAALLSLAGNLFYVFVYTKLLKRTTPQNIVIGGAAGAVPPLVGWAAVTGNVGLPALLLFAVIFYWTPPHFWSLALFTSSDYAAASVPMFPEVYGHEETRRHILLYTVMLVITSLFFFAVRAMGLFYLAGSLVLGALFLYKAFLLTRHPDEQKPLAKSLFFYSVWYLGLLFAVMVIDRVVLG